MPNAGTLLWLSIIKFHHYFVCFQKPWGQRFSQVFGHIKLQYLLDIIQEKSLSGSNLDADKVHKYIKYINH